MVFLEPTSFFVRTTVYDFINKFDDIRLKFRLIPMIHIGSEDFYKKVLDVANECEEIFYEGIILYERSKPILNTVKLKNLNFTFNQYRSIANKLDLVTQSESLDLSQIKCKLTHTDYDLKSGEKAWNALKFVEKLKLFIVLPLQLFISTKGITRERLARRFMQSSREAYLAFGPVDDEEGTSENFIMNNREQIIFKKIKARIYDESKIDKTIGIIFGAGHMNSIARYLIDNHGYIPRSGKFLKVFDL